MIGLLDARRPHSMALRASAGTSTHRISDKVAHFGQFSGWNSANLWKENEDFEQFGYLNEGVRFSYFSSSTQKIMDVTVFIVVDAFA